MERKEAIIELVQTEINYGNDLQILKEVRDQLANNPLYSSSNPNLFSHSTLLPKLIKTYQGERILFRGRDAINADLKRTPNALMFAHEERHLGRIANLHSNTHSLGSFGTLPRLCSLFQTNSLYEHTENYRGL